jgi:hypothetical protein
MESNGPVLNAGLIAARCQNCGVEAGLSAALVEVGAMLGKPVSDADALSRIKANAAAFTPPPSLNTTTPTSSPLPTATTPAVSTTSTPSSNVSSPLSTSLAVQNSATPAAERLEALMVQQIVAAASIRPSANTAAPVNIPTTEPGEAPSEDYSKLAKAAEQFEALMVEQMLRSVGEESSGGSMTSEETSSQRSELEFGETQLAQAIAARGGLGLAQMVLKSLGPLASS